MRVLAVDSSTMMLSVALIDGEEILFEHSSCQKKNMAERLQPTLEFMIKDLGVDLSSIDLYAVAVGPGSFTGLRIGIAALKMFARVYDKPICGISTLRGMAYHMFGHSVIAPMLDAKRNRVYSGLYGFQGSEFVCYRQDEALELEAYAEHLNAYDHVVLQGEGSTVYREKWMVLLGSKASFAPSNAGMTRASSVATLAASDYKKGIYTNAYDILPAYLKQAQAECELEARNRGTERGI